MARQARGTTNFGDQRGSARIAGRGDVLTNLFDGRHPGERGRHIRMLQAELQGKSLSRAP